MGERRVATTVTPIIALAVVIMSVLQFATAELYDVGNDSGWTIPDNLSFYSDWASQHTFVVNDILEFRFATGAHTVAQVSQAAYESCDTTSNPISLLSDGPANVTLTSMDSFFFICTKGAHCTSGQKLAIQVSNSSATTPPSPPSNSASSPPPPGNSASPLMAAASTSVIFGLFYLVGLLL